MVAVRRWLLAMARQKKLRVAIYSQDGLGLGHLRRNIRLSESLLEQAPESNVLLFADSPVAPFFHLPPRVDHVKLPSITKIKPGLWRPARLSIQAREMRRLRSGLLLKGLVSYRPHVFLVDHMPAGAQGELVPALKALKHACPDCSIALGLRDILDAPGVVTDTWQREGAYDALRRYYDRVLIYGSRDLFDAATTYQIPETIRGTHYCGYVTGHGPGSASEQNPPSHKAKFVFVSTGGGADGQQLLRAYLRTISLLGSRADLATLMAVGVNAPLEVVRELSAEARALGVQVVRYVEDFMVHLVAADIVVCMAGYNTLSEILTLRKKALVVPRSGPSAEQTMRARMLAERGLIDMIDPKQLSPERLAERLVADLERDDYPRVDRVLDTFGAEQAASRLLELVTDRP